MESLDYEHKVTRIAGRASAPQGVAKGVLFADGFHSFGVELAAFNLLKQAWPWPREQRYALKFDTHNPEELCEVIEKNSFQVRGNPGVQVGRSFWAPPSCLHQEGPPEGACKGNAKA